MTSVKEVLTKEIWRHKATIGTPLFFLYSHKLVVLATQSESRQNLFIHKVFNYL